MKKIAVLGAHKNALPFYRQLRRFDDYQIVSIAWPEGAVCRELCDTFYPVNFADREKVLEICRKEKIDGITSFALESALPTLTFIVQGMGLVGNGYECLELTSTKYTQRQALERAGIPVPLYWQVDTLDSVKPEQFPYPLIVKPVDSGGSQGICKVDSPDELPAAFNRAKSSSKSGRVIIEQYVDGREFSVEFISHHGRHYLLQITDKETSGAPLFVEMSHHQPADIPVETWDRIKNMVSSALTALKIEDSPSHTEIKLNSKGELFIIETGARMGGGHITSDLVRLSTGYDFVRGTVDLAVGDFKEPHFPENHHSGVYFYSQLAPYVGDVIRRHEEYPEIVEWEIEDGPLAEVRSNAERFGYFLYQTNENKRFNPIK